MSRKKTFSVIRRRCCSCCSFRFFLHRFFLPFIATEKCEKPHHSININLCAAQIVVVVVHCQALAVASRVLCVCECVIICDVFWVVLSLPPSLCNCARFQCDTISLRLLLWIIFAVMCLYLQIKWVRCRSMAGTQEQLTAASFTATPNATRAPAHHNHQFYFFGRYTKWEREKARFSNWTKRWIVAWGRGEWMERRITRLDWNVNEWETWAEGKSLQM